MGAPADPYKSKWPVMMSYLGSTIGYFWAYYARFFGYLAFQEPLQRKALPLLVAGGSSPCRKNKAGGAGAGGSSPTEATRRSASDRGHQIQGFSYGPPLWALSFFKGL